MDRIRTNPAVMNKTKSSEFSYGMQNNACGVEQCNPKKSVSSAANEENYVGFAYDHGEYPIIVAVHSNVNEIKSPHISSSQYPRNSQHAMDIQQFRESQHARNCQQTINSQHTKSIQHTIDSQHTMVSQQAINSQHARGSQHAIESKQGRVSQHIESQQTIDSQHTKSIQHTIDSQHTMVSQQAINSQHTRGSQHAIESQRGRVSQHAIESQRAIEGQQNLDILQAMIHQHLRNRQHPSNIQHPRNSLHLRYQSVNGNPESPHSAIIRHNPEGLQPAVDSQGFNYQNWLRLDKGMGNFPTRGYSQAVSLQNARKKVSLGHQNGQLESGDYFSNRTVQVNSIHDEMQRYSMRIQDNVRFQPPHYNGHHFNRFQTPPMYAGHPAVRMPRMNDFRHAYMASPDASHLPPQANLLGPAYYSNPSSRYALELTYNPRGRKRNYNQVDLGEVSHDPTSQPEEGQLPPPSSYNSSRDLSDRPSMAFNIDRLDMVSGMETNHPLPMRATPFNRPTNCNDLVNAAVISAKRYAGDNVRLVNGNNIHEKEYVVLEGPVSSSGENTKLKIPYDWMAEEYFQHILYHENRYDLLQLLKVSASSSRELLLYVTKRLLSKNIAQNASIVLDYLKRSDLPDIVKEQVLSVIEEIIWDRSPKLHLWPNVMTKKNNNTSRNGNVNMAHLSVGNEDLVYDNRGGHSAENHPDITREQQQSEFIPSSESVLQNFGSPGMKLEKPPVYDCIVNEYLQSNDSGRKGLKDHSETPREENSREENSRDENSIVENSRSQNVLPEVGISGIKLEKTPMYDCLEKEGSRGNNSSEKVLKDRSDTVIEENARSQGVIAKVDISGLKFEKTPLYNCLEKERLRANNSGGKLLNDKSDTVVEANDQRVDISGLKLEKRPIYDCIENERLRDKNSGGKVLNDLSDTVREENVKSLSVVPKVNVSRLILGHAHAHLYSDSAKRTSQQSSSDKEPSGIDKNKQLETQTATASSSLQSEVLHETELPQAIVEKSGANSFYEKEVDNGTDTSIDEIISLAILSENEQQSGPKDSVITETSQGEASEFDTSVNSFHTRDQCTQVEDLQGFDAKTNSFVDSEERVTQTNNTSLCEDSLSDYYSIEEVTSLQDSDFEFLDEI